MNNIKKFFKEMLLIYRGMGFKFFIRYFFYVIVNLNKILKTKSLNSVDKCIVKDFEISFGSFMFTFPAGALPTAREIYLKNCYNISDKRFDTCVDLGANRGIVSALLSKFSRRVVAIEMLDEFASEFQHMRKVNNIENIEYLKYAITSSSCGENEITMNSLIDKYDIKHIDFLKIDIEGAEEDIITKNNSWLEMVSEISMEVHPPFGINLEKIIDELEHFEFELTILDMEFNVHTKKSLKNMGYVWAIKK